MMAERKNRALLALAVLVCLVTLAAIVIWCTFYRVVPQPAWINADARDSYFYGSVDADQVSGVPYWLWLALPSMFPEYMPATGGYAALGLSWEEGREMPIGFAKQRIGYIRVSGNCALCHAASQRNPNEDVPTIIPVAAGHVTDIQPLLSFFRRCAQDSRFNADEILTEVESATSLSLGDKLLYRFVLIPRARKDLLNPADALLAHALQQHRQSPQSSAPFSDPQMKEMLDRMNNMRNAGPQQSQAVPAP